MIRVYVVMGVSGCGKSSVGRSLADRLGCDFYDGDDFHPVENVAKMGQGIPLDDEDRRPWLARLHELLAEHLARQEPAVLACSALKKTYREQLARGLDGVRFIFLQGEFDLIWARMKQRRGHYMKAEMLHSQFATLEPPTPAEALVVSIEGTVAEITDRIMVAIEKR